MNVPSAPSLFGHAQPPRATAVESALPGSVALVDLMYDGFYMVFLLKNRHIPRDAASFRERVRDFLTELERSTIRHRLSAEDVHEAKYAFCALVDEIVLGSVPKLRDDWERYPLQLQFFGEQLAGEHFFTRLEALRAGAAARLPVLEVFHLCLLLGFQGKYRLEGSEKLAYLTARLGDEITHLKGRRAPFAPHWAPPERLMHALKTQVPLWVMGSVFALLGLLGFIALKWQLAREARQTLAAYENVVQLPARTAHVTITLP